jgi:hypothetical protein
LLCAAIVASVAAATWPANSPVAFTSEATAAGLAGAKSVAKTASWTTGADDIRGGKTVAASRVHETQLAQMSATAARLHAAHLALLAKRAEQARRAAAAAAAGKAAAQQQASSSGSASSGSSGSAGSSGSSNSAPSGSPRQIARQILAAEGQSRQFSCLDSLWTQESDWNVYAQNPGSGAYGIPQSLPASKMASAGPDWRTSAVTQIRWGLSYIAGTYGSPCAAWSHEQAAGWY